MHSRVIYANFPTGSLSKRKNKGTLLFLNITDFVLFRSRDDISSTNIMEKQCFMLLIDTAPGKRDISRLWKMQSNSSVRMTIFHVSFSAFVLLYHYDICIHMWILDLIYNYSLSKRWNVFTIITNLFFCYQYYSSLRRKLIVIVILS